jgi:hypothetical protein
MVIGSRALSPIVVDIDKAAAFYKQLGLLPDPAGPDGTYPWDKEPWHSELHGAQAPGSQMRSMYAKAPGAVPPVTPLLIEPVEHRGIDRRQLANRSADSGVATLVLLVRDLDAVAAVVPSSLIVPLRQGSHSWNWRLVTAYGGRARAMTLAMPGGHLVELLQPDPLPPTTAPAAPSLSRCARALVHRIDVHHRRLRSAVRPRRAGRIDCIAADRHETRISSSRVGDDVGL